MSLNVLELPPTVYSALLKAAQDTGTTPVGWIAAHLPDAQKENGSLENERTDSTPMSRVQHLAYYLGTVSTAGDISQETASAALSVWNVLSQAVSALPVPDASYGPDGQFLYIWDKGEHHLEIEIESNSSIYFFYRNRGNGSLWESSDYGIGSNLSNEIVEKLRIFANA